MQDGPEVGLICRLSRTYGRVTAADQGGQQLPLKEWLKKLTREQKDDQGYPARAGQHLPGITKRTKPGITAAKSN